MDAEDHHTKSVLMHTLRERERLYTQLQQSTTTMAATPADEGTKPIHGEVVGTLLEDDQDWTLIMDKVQATQIELARALRGVSPRARRTPTNSKGSACFHRTNVEWESERLAELECVVRRLTLTTRGRNATVGCQTEHPERVEVLHHIQQGDALSLQRENSELHRRVKEYYAIISAAHELDLTRQETIADLTAKAEKYSAAQAQLHYTEAQLHNTVASLHDLREAYDGASQGFQQQMEQSVRESRQWKDQCRALERELEARNAEETQWKALEQSSRQRCEALERESAMLRHTIESLNARLTEAHRVLDTTVTDMASMRQSLASKDAQLLEASRKAYAVDDLIQRLRVSEAERSAALENLREMSELHTATVGTYHARVTELNRMLGKWQKTAEETADTIEGIDPLVEDEQVFEQDLSSLRKTLLHVERSVT